MGGSNISRICSFRPSVRFVRGQKKIPAPIPAVTARVPITPPTMGPTGVEFLDIGREVLDCVELGYRPVEDEDEVEDEPVVEDELELELELLLGIVVEVVFSMIGELDPDSVVDFYDDAVPMTVKNARPTCPV